MPELNFNVFDWVVIAVIAMSSVMGFMRGIIREIFTAVSIVGAAVAALIYLRNSDAINLLPFVQPAWLQVVATAAAVFAIVFVGLGFATSSIAALLHKSAEITALDRGAGLAYGFARAALIAVLTVVLVRHVTPQDRTPPAIISQAQLYPLLERGAVGLEYFIRDHKRDVEDRIKAATKAASPEKQ